MSSSGLHSISQSKEVKLNLFSWHRTTTLVIYSQQMDKEIMRNLGHEKNSQHVFTKNDI